MLFYRYFYEHFRERWWPECAMQEEVQPAAGVQLLLGTTANNSRKIRKWEVDGECRIHCCLRNQSRKPRGSPKQIERKWPWPLAALSYEKGSMLGAVKENYPSLGWLAACETENLKHAPSHLPPWERTCLTKPLIKGTMGKKLPHGLTITAKETNNVTGIGAMETHNPWHDGPKNTIACLRDFVQISSQNRWCLSMEIQWKKQKGLKNL